MTVFISYRRADTQQAAGRLYEHLSQRYGREHVVIDVATNQIGRDYRVVINEELDRASVVLALIGRRFLEPEGERRRIHEDNDLVRLELAKALERGLPIVPVLVDGAVLPDRAELPDDIGDLVYRGALELAHVRFDRDAGYLADQIAHLLDIEGAGPGAGAPEQPIAPAPGPETPPTRGPGSPPAEHLLAGVQRGFDAAVASATPTFGPTDVITVTVGEGGPGGTNVTGREIALAMTSSDPEEQVGIEIARSVAEAAYSATRDGTTTALVLAHAMSDVALPRLRSGASATALRRGIEAAARRIDDEIRRTSTALDPGHGVTALLDALGVGPAEADVVRAAIDHAGPAGAIVTLDGGTELAPRMRVVPGYRIHKGYLNPHFVTDAGGHVAILDNPYLLVTDADISSVQQILPMLESVLATGRPFVVVAGDVDGEALATLVVNKIRGTLRSAAIKAPDSGDRRAAILQDIAIMTGGQVISDAVGPTLADATIDLLGSAAKVIITKDDTTIVDGGGHPREVTGHIEQLRTRIGHTEAERDRDPLRSRLAELERGVAVIDAGLDEPFGNPLVGMTGPTRRRRIASAVESVRACLDGGVLRGAGIDLVRIRQGIDITEFDPALRLGAEALLASLDAPARTLARNAGIDPDELVDMVADDPDLAFARLAGAFGTPADGLVDASSTTASALAAATHGTVRLLLTRTVRGATTSAGGDQAATAEDADPTDTDE